MARAELPYASPTSITTWAFSATMRSRSTSPSELGTETRSKSPLDRMSFGPTSASLRRVARTRSISLRSVDTREYRAVGVTEPPA